MLKPLYFSRPSRARSAAETASSTRTIPKGWGVMGYADAEADMLLAEASSAICVQRFDGSRNSAIHTTYRISLRSSSLREPRYPLLRVVSVSSYAAQGNSINKYVVRCVLTEGARRHLRGTPRSRQFCGSRVGIDRFNDPSAGSPTETLLRLLLPLGGRV